MPKRKSNQPAILPNQLGASPFARGGYFWLSSHPLHMLLFLLPIIIVYEIGSMGLVGGGVMGQLEAQAMLVRFFDLFGVLGLHLPALALVVTLVVQHVLSKEPWKIRPTVPLIMAAESTFLTIPLIVLAVVLEPVAAAMLVQEAQQASAAVDPSVAMNAGAGESSTLQGLFLALGAGLYEEMLFRLVLITILHFVVTDVLGCKHKTGNTVAVILSALAFAWHHDQVHLPGHPLNWRLAVFYALAGAYFGVLFLARGLGLAVGAHLMYDVLVFVVMPGVQDQPA